MRTSGSNASRTIFRVARRALLGACFVVGLGHTECEFHSCHDDHHDDHHDSCDDHHHDEHQTAPAPSAVPGSLRLLRYEMIPSRDPRAHAVAQLIRIEDIALPEPVEASADAERMLRDFTARVIEDNAGLIGLPEQAGRLAFDEVRFADSATTVAYKQRAKRFVGRPRDVRGARLEFVFDGAGRLVEIDNSTRIVLD
jgi:hypothetical protein